MGDVDLDGTVSWRALRDEAPPRSRRSASQRADADARWLVEEASGYEGAEHHLRLDHPAPQRGVAHFDAMVARREEGEPLAYVLGRWSFRTLDLAVDRRVLIPRPETEEVAGLALAELDRLAPRRVHRGRPRHRLGRDRVGARLERAGVEVWATDRSPDALAVARANLAGLGGWAAPRVRLVEGDWFEALPADLAGRIAVIVSNPPYVAEGDALPDDVRRPGAGERAHQRPDRPRGRRADRCRSRPLVGAGWIARGRDRRDPGRTVRRAGREAAGFAEVEIRADLASRPGPGAEKWPASRGSEAAARRVAVVDDDVGAGQLVALRAGQPVVIPTDTVYGLAALPTIPGATEALQRLKDRSADQALAVTWSADSDRALASELVQPQRRHPPAHGSLLAGPAHPRARRSAAEPAAPWARGTRRPWDPLARPPSMVPPARSCAALEPDRGHDQRQPPWPAHAARCRTRPQPASWARSRPWSSTVARPRQPASPSIDVMGDRPRRAPRAGLAAADRGRLRRSRRACHLVP